ncbi:MAG: methionyl-tRNA formyltransferase [Planctomycetaceae bacterium]|nr:methionyl-tRNA formyltransferase [Planctomycetaceae bacterium]
MTLETLKIVVMGTGPFAVPMFRALYASRHQVQALFTQPTRPTRGNRPPPSNPMRETAEAHGTPVFAPESINTPEGRSPLVELQPDLLVVADYGQILAPETLGLARLGGINLHGSLLPKYRGAAPINWAIYHGDAETGVTVIHMTPRVDAGPRLSQARTPIGPDETAPHLEHRLSEHGAPLIVETIDSLLSGDVRPLVQDPALTCGARRLRKTDGEVQWSRSAEQIQRQIRAFEPWPRTSTTWLRADHPPIRLILGPVVAHPDEQPQVEPGTVTRAAGNELCVATGAGVVELTQLQPAGKRMMPVGDFLRGHPVQPGDHFGPEPMST